ncbi:YMGG-like glycine zipper-containing protein [Granulicella arctica]|uniref:YMGG-like Gly-zipper domain-containing protein n=1 Tax=Granulicella arctica TaxID=940613 RepID=A0A7Y9PF93_9BACT|nr:YMGG-like glycine zipper-containing protein [Granulicella arctica]NYF78826.1 hypothetical protein [Granulicella arctica]
MLKNTFLRRATLLIPLFVTTTLTPAFSQDYHDNHQRNQYYNGVRDGGRGGNYDRGRRDHYDDRYYQQPNQGGIGPGKGALIGAGGGAVLGALFGGGLKGAVIGGAAGAGVGALVGKAHQDNQRREYY